MLTEYIAIGGVTIGRSNVIQADIAASNGVIHVIDAVILPEPQPNLVKVLTSDKRFSTLATAATVAGLIPTLESGKSIIIHNWWQSYSLIVI